MNEQLLQRFPHLRELTQAVLKQTDEQIMGDQANISSINSCSLCVSLSTNGALESFLLVKVAIRDVLQGRSYNPLVGEIQEALDKVKRTFKVSIPIKVLLYQQGSTLLPKKPSKFRALKYYKHTQLANSLDAFEWSMRGVIGSYPLKEGGDRVSEHIKPIVVFGDDVGIVTAYSREKGDLYDALLMQNDNEQAEIEKSWFESEVFWGLAPGNTDVIEEAEFETVVSDKSHDEDDQTVLEIPNIPNDLITEELTFDGEPVCDAPEIPNPAPTNDSLIKLLCDAETIARDKRYEKVTQGKRHTTIVELADLGKAFTR